MLNVWPNKVHSTVISLSPVLAINPNYQYTKVLTIFSDWSIKHNYYLCSDCLLKSSNIVYYLNNIQERKMKKSLSSSWQGNYYAESLSLFIRPLLRASVTFFFYFFWAIKLTSWLPPMQTPQKSTANETFITLECIYSPSHPHTQGGSPFNFNLLLIITSALLPFTSISLPLRPIWHPPTPS